MATESIKAAAREALTLHRVPQEAQALLFDRACRLIALIDPLACQPEMSNRRFDRQAVEAAALFFEACRAHAIRDARLSPAEALSAPIGDSQREGSIDALLAAPVELKAETREAAATAIRQHAWRSGASAEAELLAEAVHLDDLGPLGVWRQAGTAGASHAAIQSVLNEWQRQCEYGYWETRINELLRFNWSRQIARRRVAAIQVFLESLGSQFTGAI